MKGTWHVRGYGRTAFYVNERGEILGEVSGLLDSSYVAAIGKERLGRFINEPDAKRAVERALQSRMEKVKRLWPW